MHPQVQTYYVRATKKILAPRGLRIPVEIRSRARLSHVKIHLRTKLVPGDLRTIWSALNVIRGRVMIRFIKLTLRDDLESVTQV